MYYVCDIVKLTFCWLGRNIFDPIRLTRSYIRWFFSLVLFFAECACVSLASVLLSIHGSSLGLCFFLKIFFRVDSDKKKTICKTGKKAYGLKLLHASISIAAEKCTNVLYYKFWHKSTYTNTHTNTHIHQRHACIFVLARELYFVIVLLSSLRSTVFMVDGAIRSEISLYIDDSWYEWMCMFDCVVWWHLLRKHWTASKSPGFVYLPRYMTWYLAG